MIKEAVSHIESGGGNCATASYRALLPEGVAPSVLHDRMLMKESYYISHIATCTALRVLAETGMWCSILEMPDEMKPSEFVSNCVSEARNDTHDAHFLGALLRMNYIDKSTGKFLGHVIAVTKVDLEQKTATIVNGGPNDELSWSYSIPLDGLDRLITSRGKGKYVRALAMVGLSPQHPECQNFENSQFLQRAATKWKSWEQSYAEGFNITPSYLST